MANHGYCKNCWWYKQTKLSGYKFESGKLIEIIGEGICYMHSKNIGFKNAELLYDTTDNSYCPDYWNRNKMNKTDGLLEDWIKKQY